MNSQVIDNCLEFINDSLESIDRLDMDLEQERESAKNILKLLIIDLQKELEN
jgi:hypothetical protein